MIGPLPQHHPYAPGARVHHAAETDVHAYTVGSATVVAHRYDPRGRLV